MCLIRGTGKGAVLAILADTLEEANTDILDHPRGGGEADMRKWQGLMNPAEHERYLRGLNAMLLQ
jgi:hypothetical protein